MARRQRNSLEHNEQVALFEWIRWMRNTDERFKCIYAVPNGFQGSPAAGQWMKDEGLEPGVPDICVAVPQTYEFERCGDACLAMRYAGLYIEMKAPYRKKEKSGGLEPSQREWLERLARMGYKTAVCYSQDEARAVICEYLGVKDSAVTGNPDIWERAEEGHNEAEYIKWAHQDPMDYALDVLVNQTEDVKSLTLIPRDGGMWQVDIIMSSGERMELTELSRETARDLFNKHRNAQKTLTRNGV